MNKIILHFSCWFLVKNLYMFIFVLLFRGINASSTFVEAAARRRPSKRWQTVQVSTYTQNSDVMFMRNTPLTTSCLVSLEKLMHASFKWIFHLAFLTGESLSGSRGGCCSISQLHVGDGRVHPWMSPLPCSRVPRHCSEGVLAPSPTRTHTKFLFAPGLKPRILHFSAQSSMDHPDLIFYPYNIMWSRNFQIFPWVDWKHCIVKL